MTINQEILSWARPKVGTRVGDGECWTYVENAVTQAGGVSSRTLTPNFGPDSNYVWGDTVALGSLQAGDLLQFRNYRWVRTTEEDVTFDDGGGGVTSSEAEQTRPHHSAIVTSLARGGGVQVLEQNIPPGTAVVNNLLQLSSARRPPRTTQEQRRNPNNNNRMERARVVTTVADQVTGSIWAYRATTP